MKINHSFQINTLLKMISPHFLEVLKIGLIIVNINKDENKSLISNQFSPKNDL
jgi:hypothetical protein